MTNPRNPTNRRAYLDWQDVAFTALTGWVNVCRDSQTGEVDTEPCPGVLIQRATTQEVSWDDTSNPVRRLRITEDLVRPETRTVFTYAEGAEIMPLDHDSSGWYLFSAPADHPNVAAAIAASGPEVKARADAAERVEESALALLRSELGARGADS